jgi:diguanylate cyclase (GGDEF)-like protein
MQSVDGASTARTGSRAAATAFRVAVAVFIGGVLLLMASVLLQAGKQQRQFRAQHQEQLRQAVLQASLTVRSRLGNAEVMLRGMTERMPADRDGNWNNLLAALQQDAGFFGAVTVVPAEVEGSFEYGARRFTLTPREQEALREGRTVLLAPRTFGPGRLYLMRNLKEPAPQRHLLAEMREGWWSLLMNNSGSVQLLAFDASGQMHMSSRNPSMVSSVPDVARARLATLGPGEATGDIAWTENGEPWVGAVASMQPQITVSDAGLVLVAMGRDRPWSAFFWSAVRTQATFLPLVLLAAWLAWAWMRRQELALKRLHRALGSLPDRYVELADSPGLMPELRQVIQAGNRAGEAIELQNHTRRVLEEIDALLLPGGDYESVLDQVLTRVRAVTRAHNVGLTLVDPVSGHGRLFVVGASGGQPVTRVTLDGDMVARLLDSEQGLTIARCEEGRHSFIEPLQGGGATFFWIWPVMAGGELAAVLAVGFAEVPAGAAGIAETGTQCAQRLGLALASHARAERLYRQAHFDPLTQLPNRQLFRDQLHAELQNAVNNGGRGALLYIDLDHFKRVNDSLGHEAGDQLLAIVAQRLRSCVKEEDTVARLGGDEFTVILRHVCDSGEVAGVAQRIIDAMRKPVRLGGREHLVRASIGIAMFPSDGNAIDELLHHADLAMYRAKEQGRGSAEFYNPKMGLRSADSGLFRALSRREFSLYYQPQYRVSDGGLAGVEALLRWQPPGSAMRTSAKFVPAAEESGLIVDLGSWVLESACAQFAQWRDAGIAPPVLAVNLSVQQLRDEQLVPMVRRLLERHRLPPSSLAFEISEAALTDEDSQQRILELSETGVGLTLDDFGTGNTSLANLRRFPVQAVKIDRSFVERIETDAEAAALAGTIIVMAHSLDRKVIAEGVESAGQLDYLRERHCDLAQGYFLARPLSLQDMTSLLLGRQATAASHLSAARG